MQITVGQLRVLLRQGLEEATVSASPEYMKKEKVRQDLQDYIAAQVAAGKIKSQKQLEKFMAYVAQENLSPDQALALTALKMIPFEVWKKLGSNAQ